MVIELLFDHHDRFLLLCDPASREYEILKSAVVRRPKEGRYERGVGNFAAMQEGQIASRPRQ